MSGPSQLKPVGTSPVEHGPWVIGRQGWKRASVIVSIGLSIASLGVSATASLRREDYEMLRILNITGIVINAISVSLSALTSLDWRTETQNIAEMQRRLLRLVRIEEDAAGRLIHVLRLGPDDNDMVPVHDER